MNAEHIQTTIGQIKATLEELAQKSHQCSLLRLVLLLVILYTGYQGYQNTAWWYGISVIAIVIFVIIVRRHAQIHQMIEDQELLREAYEDIEKRKGKGWRTFRDDGHDFLNETTTQAYDLDLFGKASLFQYVSVAKTAEGRAALAAAFSWQSQSHEDIGLRQEAVAECIRKEQDTMKLVQLLKLFEKHSHKHKKRMAEKFYAMLKTETKPQSLIFHLLSYGLPCITWLGIIGMLIRNRSYLLFSIGFSLSLCICLLATMYHGEQLAVVGRMQEWMKDYERMLYHLQQASYESTYIRQLQMQLEDAHTGMRRLQILLGFVRLRENFITNILFNGCFMLDFHCARAFHHWRNAYGVQVESWLKAIGQMEMLLSLTQLSYAKEQVCFPQLHDSQEPSFTMQGMTHPLLCEEEAVPNDVQAAHGSYVITGSNMSGKTTFLRTIGVNMILLHAGAMVCAKQCVSSMLSVYTSMRVQDDVSEGISTFYAEILRIKEMMDASKAKQPMLVLIDEIFKGTNSADRIQCAIQAIRCLHQPWIITMVSTHDFELCDLEQDPDIQAQNDHFSEYYEEDRICFDYRLKQGRCQTTNAKQLMKLAGFYEDRE